MKKIILVFIAVLLLASCYQRVGNNFYEVKGEDVPATFHFVENRGNGYYLYEDDLGLYLVWKQCTYGLSYVVSIEKIQDK